MSVFDNYVSQPFLNLLNILEKKGNGVKNVETGGYREYIRAITRRVLKTKSMEDRVILFITAFCLSFIKNLNFAKLPYE